MSSDTIACGEAAGVSGRGTFYGVGVGPGAPDLLSLRAVNVLRSVQVVLAAASPKNEDSLALSIAAPHLRPGARVERLDFPMTRDRALLREAWEGNADTVMEVLDQGLDAAFLTLGDPLIYSTFGYLLRTLRERDADVPVGVVSGITSFQDAAAQSLTVLCEGEENLVLLSGINGPQRLRQALSLADGAVILKTYKNADAIYAALREAGRSEDALFATRLGLEGEALVRDFASMPAHPHYLSLLLVPPRRS